MVIYDLHKDICNGVAFINLLEILSGKTVKEYHRKPTTVQQMLQNCDLVIKFLLKLEIQVQARPKDFYNGNMAIIFGALYLLIKKVKEKKNSTTQTRKTYHCLCGTLKKYSFFNDS